MFSERYLNYLSSHSISQKKGIVTRTINKATLLTDPEFHDKKLGLQFILLKNDYSMDFIFNAINI